MRHFLNNHFNTGSMEEYFLSKEIVSLNLTAKTKHRAAKEWTGEPPCHN